MELYKIGKVASIGKTYIIFDCNYTGLIVYVADSTKWEKDLNVFKKIYVFKYESEFISSYYGFHTFNERILFEDLLSVNGVGPKTALSLLRSAENALAMIASNDVKGLASIPGIGLRTANQIVFSLHDKYEKFSAKLTSQGSTKINPVEAQQSLKVLGFNKKQIDYAMNNMQPEDNIEILVEKAIKIIANAKIA